MLTPSSCRTLGLNMGAWRGMCCGRSTRVMQRLPRLQCRHSIPARTVVWMHGRARSRLWVHIHVRGFGMSNRPPETEPSLEKQRALNSRMIQTEGREDLLSLAREEGQHFNFVNMATCINRLSRLTSEERQRVRTDARFEQLIRRVEGVMTERSETVHGQALGNIINGLAKLRYHPGHNFLKLFVHACVMADLRSFKPQELAINLHGLARLGHHPSNEFMSAFMDSCISRKLRGFRPPDLTNVIYGVAQVGQHPGPDFMRVFVDACMARELQGFKPQELTGILNGLARLGHDPGADFMQLFVRTCLATGLRDFGPQGLPILIRGLAKLDHCPNSEFMGSFVRACMATKLHGFTPQGLANVIHGLARVGHVPEVGFLELFVRVCDTTGLQHFKPQELAALMDGLGKLQYCPPEPWMQNLLAVCTHNDLEGFGAVELTGLISGLANVRYVPGRDFAQSFTAVCVNRIDGVGEQEMATILSSLARLGLPLPTSQWECLMAACLQQKNLSVQCVTSVIWAAAVYQRLNEVPEVVITRIVDLAEGTAMPSHLTHLYQAVKQALYSLEAPEDTPVRQLLQQLQAVIPPQCQIAQRGGTSEVQRTIAHCLRVDMGMRALEEQVVAGGAISADILIMPREGRGKGPVVVEFDGPRHYCSNGHRKAPTNTTLFKRRLLRLAVERGEVEAWVSVPHWSWRALKGCRDHEMSCLWELLQAAGVDLAEYAP